MLEELPCYHLKLHMLMGFFYNLVSTHLDWSNKLSQLLSDPSVHSVNLMGDITFKCDISCHLVIMTLTIARPLDEAIQRKY